MLKEVYEIFKDSVIAQQNPGIIIIFACVLTFLLSSKPIFEFFNSGNDFLNKVRYARYLRIKEIYEDPITDEENQKIAKEIVDSFQFKELTGIDVDKKSRKKLALLANQSEEKNIWIYIRSSIKYLSFDEDLVKIIPETRLQSIGRYLLNLCAIFYALLFILCFYSFLFVELQGKYYVLNIFLIVLFYLSFLYFLRKTSYFYSLKKIDRIIKDIQRNSEPEGS